MSCGEVIADYPDDTPYPSKLLLGWVDDRPIHVVLAIDGAGSRGFIVTAYEPEASLWDETFRRRKRS